jgi:Holliday junction resolvase RusA-like endonuclease
LLALWVSYTIEIAGTPPRKNRRHIVVGRGQYAKLINSPEFKAFALALEVAWAKAQHPRRIFWGLWKVEIHAVWPRTRHLDSPVAHGDVDAPISAVLDGFQEAGILDDDARIVELVASKSQGPIPSTRITLTPL